MAPMEIVLDPRPGSLPGTTSTLYTAGDIVSGHARVSVPADSIKSLSIDFTGSLRVCIPNNATGSSTQQTSSLFTYSLQPIIPNPTGKYTFAFTVPPTILVNPDSSSSSSSGNSAPRHVPPAPQPLLPSFSYGKVAAGYGEPGARIEYTLIAKLEYKSTIFTRRDNKTKTIHISAPLMPGKTKSSKGSILPIEHTWALQSSRLRPGMEHHKPSAMERFSSFFTSPTSGDPKLIVALGIDMPSVLTLGTDIPTSLSLNFLPDSTGIEIPPRIYLSKLTATLHIITDFAIGTTTKRKETTMDLCTKSFAGRTQLLEYGYARKLDIGEWMSENFTLDAGNQLVPTFATPSLRRRYNIEIEVAVECVGETWKKSFESEVLLIPAVSSSNGLGSGSEAMSPTYETSPTVTYSNTMNSSFVPAGPARTATSSSIANHGSGISNNVSSPVGGSNGNNGESASGNTGHSRTRPSEKGQPMNAVQLDDDYGPPPSYSEF
ncbi:hypothetical protein TWF696_008601 [Orbilia brochopaga]|uniref:Arrestin-like N-terminal domain-containing protein n=1 Tax=Orbilia brochopaga TaxID=3140254 RepID=A0AAV9UGN1_9PEZI